MQLTEILTPERIKIPLSARTKQEAIEELLDLLVANGDVRDREPALQAVTERERTRSTGIGNGLAVPHGKCSAVDGLVMAMGVAPEGIDFQSVDGRPVTLVALLLAPVDQTGPHIQALARISRVLTTESVRRRAKTATRPAQLLKIIAEEEREESVC